MRVIEEGRRGADRSPTSRARNGEKSPASPNSDGLMLSPRVDILSPAYRARCGAPRTTSSGFANLWSRIPSPQSTFRRHSCRSGQHNAGLVVPQFEFLFAISAARRKAAIASNSTEKCSASLWYTSIVPVGCPFATSNASITFMSLARPGSRDKKMVALSDPGLAGRPRGCSARPCRYGARCVRTGK